MASTFSTSSKDPYLFLFDETRCKTSAWKQAHRPQCYTPNKTAVTDMAIAYCNWYLHRTCNLSFCLCIWHDANERLCTKRVVSHGRTQAAKCYDHNNVLSVEQSSNTLLRCQHFSNKNIIAINRVFSFLHMHTYPGQKSLLCNLWGAVEVLR